MNIFDKSLNKVSYQRVLDEIAEEHYFTLDKAVDSNFSRLSLVMVCVLITKNGFTFTGQSATNSKENFDEVLSKKIAKDKAINELWGMIAYQDRTSAMIAEIRNIGFGCDITDEATWKTGE